MRNRRSRCRNRRGCSSPASPACSSSRRWSASIAEVPRWPRHRRTRHRQPERAHQRVVDDGDRGRHRLRVRQGRRDRAVRASRRSSRCANSSPSHRPARGDPSRAGRGASSSSAGAVRARMRSSGTGCTRSSFPSTRSCSCRSSPPSRPTRKHFLERTAKIQWGLMICVFCISHVPALAHPGHPGLRRARTCCS